MIRSVLAWRILEDDLVGTYHMPSSPPSTGHTSAHRVGVLLLNPGPAPRAGNSDLSVRIGDRLASRGIPVFRFDLPGLGDSSGLVPLEIHTYWQEILRGRNDAATLALVDKLKQQFGLTKVIVGGLCAATVPTLNVAGRHANAIAGAILIEPAFRLPRVNAIENVSDMATITTTFRTKVKLRKLFSPNDWLIFMAGDSRIAEMLRPLLTKIHQKLIGHSLPIDMNVPLFMHWRSSLARGTHSLVVVAEGLGNDRYVDHAIESLPTKAPGKINLIRVPNTNHILTGGHARDMVLDALEQWMAERFSCGTT